MRAMVSARSGWRLALVVLVAMAGALAPPTAPLVRAAEELRIAVDTTYRIDANDGVVRVRMDITATNLKPPTTRQTATGTVTTRYYYDRLIFSIQVDARSVRATSGNATLRASLDTQKTHRQVTVRIPNLFYQQARKVRIEYDLRGGAPRSESNIRVGEAFATFTAWGWGDPGRSTVRIVMPAGFTNDGYGEELTTQREAGRTVLASGAIDDPDDWYAVIVADRPGSLTSVRVGSDAEPIVVRAWPEDTAWRDQVSSVLEDGVPLLKELIGLDWPVEDVLTVTEVHSPLLEGYAGVYESYYDQIRMSEDLDPQTILHEASHAWFDFAFTDERWIVEGLAEQYSAAVGTELGLEVPAAPPAVDRAAKEAYPLADWPPLARLDDDDSFARARYGYDASWTVMREIVDEVGDEGMRRIFRMMADQTIGYVGDAPAENSGLRYEWRRFLDLVQEIGGAEGADELFRTWVVPPSEHALLAERETARETYATLDAAAGDWAVPYLVRSNMWSWAFDDATAGMAAATSVVEQRNDLTEVVDRLGVAPPDDLEDDFEEAASTADLGAIGTVLDARSAAAEELIRTRDALALELTPLAALGLAGELPSAGFDDGLAAFTAGDLKGATVGAAQSITMLASAESIGQARALAVGGSVIGMLIALLVIALLLRRRGARRRLDLAAATGLTAAIPGDVGGTGGASSTLAASPDPATVPSADTASASPPPAGAEPD